MKLEKEYLKQLKKKQADFENDKDNILKDTDYINWLVTFLNKTQGFIVEELLLNDNLSEEDKKNIAMLPSFYKVLEHYAHNNYLYPNLDNNMLEFSFTYLNHYYKIGTLKDSPGLLHLCRETKKEKISYIDFSDVLVNRPLRFKNYITADLKSLKLMITELHARGVPLNAIEESVKETVESLRLDELGNNTRRR